YSAFRRKKQRERSQRQKLQDSIVNPGLMLARRSNYFRGELVNFCKSKIVAYESPTGVLNAEVVPLLADPQEDCTLPQPFNQMARASELWEVCTPAECPSGRKENRQDFGVPPAHRTAICKGCLTDRWESLASNPSAPILQNLMAIAQPFACSAQ